MYEVLRTDDFADWLKKLCDGYRVYYTKRGKEIILPLIGGDKSMQNNDIKKAERLARDYLLKKNEVGD